jgi:FkbM family methyltransferase
MYPVVMKKILIDCGGNIGQSYDTFKNELDLDNFYKIFIFEPNIDCYNILLRKIDASNVIIKNQAVYNKNGTVKFYIPTNDAYSLGSTLNIDFHNSIYKNMYKDSIEVECIDLDEFVRQIECDAEIYLKLDIEGAEYEVLELLIKNETINRIHKIYVEFHEKYANDELSVKYDLISRKNNIIDYIKSNNISFTEWT